MSNKTLTGPIENNSEKFENPAWNIKLKSLSLENDIITDEIGRILKKIEILEGEMNEFYYKYDEDGRLISVYKNNELVEEYRYDLKGRRIFETNLLMNIFKRKYYYKRDRLVKAGRHSFFYDEKGRLIKQQTSCGCICYNYGELNNIIGIVDEHGCKVNYRYDDRGRRQSVFYDGVQVAEYKWDNSRLLEMMDGQWWKFNYEKDSRVPNSLEKNGEEYQVGIDSSGTIRVLQNSEGKIVLTRNFDSFGNLLDSDSKDFGLPFGFAGGLVDEYSQLIHFYFRDYSPQFARWNTLDPLGKDAGDVDLYGYCLDDPINFVDFLGDRQSPGGLMVSALGGLAGRTWGRALCTTIGGAAFGPAGAIAGAVLGVPVGMAASILYDEFLAEPVNRWLGWEDEKNDGKDKGE